MEVMTSPDEQALRAQVDQARDTLRRLADELDTVDAEFDALAPQRTQHELLDQACGSLEKLAELGVASLFWGDRNDPAATADTPDTADAGIVNGKLLGDLPGAVGAVVVDEDRLPGDARERRLEPRDEGRDIGRLAIARDELEREIEITLAHEIAHYLGIDEETLDRYGYG